MTAPTKLTGSTTTIKVDDIDLHTYGMIVTDIRNPCPSARDASFQIAQRDGDFDFTTHYGPRTMTLSGSIIGNSNSDLYSRIDDLKKFFRLRKDKGTFQVIFQNQTDRYWTCRFQSFDVGAIGKWFTGHTAAFTLVLKCVKPYAEATSITSVDDYLHCNKNKVVSYTGSIDTPLALKITQRLYENILEKVAGACSEDNTLWTYSNATGSDDGGNMLFGTACPKATRTAGGEFYAEIDVTAQITTTKYYVFGCFIRVNKAATNYLEAIIAGGINVSETFSLPGDTDNWYFKFIKVPAENLTGSSSVKFRVRNSGSADNFLIDGAFIYEISMAEDADTDYFPPPYMSDPAGDDFVPPKNPSLILHKNVNLYRWENGQTTGWVTAGGSVVPFTARDPYNPGEKCLLICTEAGSDSCWSGIIYVTPGLVHQLIFDYYIEKISGTIEIGFCGFMNEKTLSYREVSIIASPMVTAGWVHNYTAETYRVAIPAECGIIRFFVYQAGAGSLKMFLKNIQIARATLVTDPLVPYVKPDKASLAYTGTIAADDDLLIDNETFAAEYFDYSAAAASRVSNAMSALSGEPLILCPGTNSLRYLDSRETATNPETDSCGGVNCSISYRARYL